MNNSSLAPVSLVTLPEPTISVIEEVIALWVHGKSPHTQRYYRRAARQFLGWVGKPLDRVTLADVQEYATSLTTSGLAPSSQARAIASIKSLFTFLHKQLGILRVNPAGALVTPKSKDTLAERILPEGTVLLMINLETNPRNKTLLKLLYVAGLRVCELTELTWRALQERDDGGQVLVYGKGGKTRAVKLPASLWSNLQLLQASAELDTPVFPSRKGKGNLTQVQVNRIVKRAAGRVPGLDPEVSAKISPHWLRHAHATHAMDRGAPIHLVQATLGHSSVATTGRYLHARPNDSSARFLPVV